MIPSYNAAAFLTQALALVWDQTLPPAEILAIDDGSEDGSLQVARRLGARTFAREHRGAAAARALLFPTDARRALHQGDRGVRRRLGADFAHGRTGGRARAE